jgi:hypothetical protein
MRGGRVNAVVRKLLEEHKATYKAVWDGLAGFVSDDLAAFNEAAASAGLEPVRTPPHLGAGFEPSR